MREREREMKRGVGGDDKDFVWRFSEPWKKLPVLKWKQLKLGPAFGFGPGCGFGFGVGLIGGIHTRFSMLDL